MATATISSSSLLLPNQQQPQKPLRGDEIEPTPPTNVNLIAAPNGPNHYSSGSIGPFFAVISVLVVLAVLSCFLGQICARRRQKTVSVAEVNPMVIIKGGRLLGSLRQKWRRCLAGEPELEFLIVPVKKLLDIVIKRLRLDLCAYFL